MSGGAVTLQAQSHVAKYSGLDEALHCRSLGCGEGVAGLPQSGQAGSTSFCPHRRKLSGVGRVFEIALRLN